MISVYNIKKTFPNEETIVYRDIVFENGKKYMLLGASGCGKSTFLNMIAGILSPDCGEIAFDGVEMSKKSQSEKDSYRVRHIGYVFQDFKLMEEMTVLDNIRILSLEGVSTKNVGELLKKLGIYEQRNKKVKHLSGGQKQRVAIARALVKEPDIILADEPTGNLNFETGLDVMNLLADCAKDKILIAVSHDERLSSFFDEVIDMNEIIEKSK